MSHRRAPALLLAFLLAPAVAPTQAAADESLPVIAAGREKEVLALIAPYQLGSPLGNGWHLENVNISGEFVRLLALGPKGEAAAVRLELPKRKPSSETTPSFAVHREVQAGKDGAKPDPRVLDPLVEAVRKNDNGRFWPEKGPTVPVFDPPRPEKPNPPTGGGGGEPPSVQQPGTAPEAAAPSEARGFAGLRRLLLAGGLVLILAVLLLGRVRGGKSS